MPATLTVGIILLNRLVEHYGQELRGGRAFPEPPDVKFADPEQLVRLGYSDNKARALSILELAEAIGDNGFQPVSLESANHREALVSLLRLLSFVARSAGAAGDTWNIQQTRSTLPQSSDVR